MAVLRAPAVVALHRRTRFLRSVGLIAFVIRVAAVLSARTDWPEPIGFRRDGRPIYPIAGAAVTITLKNSSNVTTNANSYTVVATPDASGLCICVVTVSGATTGFSMSDTQTLRWSLIKSQSYNTNGQFQNWYIARKLAAASSTTFTFACTSGTGCIMQLFSVSGTTRTGWSAIRQITSGALTFNASTVPQPTFSLAALTGNGVLAVASNATLSGPALTPNTGWTETATTGDIGYNTPATGQAESHRNSGFTSATVSAWVTATSATAGICFAIEIDATTPSFVQSASVNNTASSTTVAQDFDFAVTVGNALTCSVYWNAGSGSCTVSDSVNGAWIAVGGPQVGAAAPLNAYSFQAFYLPGTAAGTPTVTATFNAARTDYALAIAEAAAKGGLDTSAVIYQAQNGTTTPQTASFTPTMSRCTIVTSILFGGGNQATPSSSFTMEQRANFANNGLYAKVLTAGGAQQLTEGTTTSQQTVSFIFALDTDPKSLPGVRKDPMARASRDFDDWTTTGWL